MRFLSILTESPAVAEPATAEHTNFLGLSAHNVEAAVAASNMGLILVSILLAFATFLLYIDSRRSHREAVQHGEFDVTSQADLIKAIIPIVTAAVEEEHRHPHDQH